MFVETILKRLIELLTTLLGPTTGFQRKVVSGYAMIKRMQSRHHRGQRWAADRCCQIAALEDNTATRQLIEMWRLDRLMPHKTIVRPRLVVAQDQDDIGGLICVCFGSKNEGDG